MIWTLRELISHCNEVQTEIKPGVWVPAKPIPFGGWWHRLKDAWEVFTGRADAFKWPGKIEK